ncbi:hypothetical protein AJ79_01521 [Helicocarpus griseus UAMH5409]|uniref:Mid2 domain-containing protein n=1 Tax=Helicocarpus griseus UAMH5409 TaxID=1447875 RepID=A0A2B7Y8D7_9EURO|nr:hypothetical protein AJ79_01521 [Helicocarpus griseus UAMH5409]
MARSTAVLSLSLTLLSLWATGVRGQHRMCYALDGTPYPFDVPCTNDEVTICCNPGDICMSNGLCYLQGSHGMVLSRGSCTDRNWGPLCNAPCSKYARNIGFPIVNMGFNKDNSDYCCGQTDIVNGKIGCLNGDKPFKIRRGTAIPGIAGLASNATSAPQPSPTPSDTANPSIPSTAASPTDPASSSPTEVNMPSSSTCPASHETAIGAGVGIPLGVIALASLAWAIWERRGRQKALAEAGGAVGAAGANGSYVNRHEVEGNTKHPAELYGREEASELMGNSPPSK